MRKGITFSAFDLLHSGHVDMLRQAKEQCDYLIVGLHTDPTIDRPEKNRPIQTTLERYIQLKGCKYVDEIIPYDTEEDVRNIIYMVDPDVRIIGEDYMEQDFTGKDDCKFMGIEIFYNQRKHNYSTTNLRKRICKSQS